MAAKHHQESLRSSSLGIRSRPFASPRGVCAVSRLRRTPRPGPAAAALAKRHVVPGALPRKAPRVRLRFLCRQAAGSSQGSGSRRSTDLAQGPTPGSQALEASARGKRTRLRHRGVELKVPHRWVQGAELEKERTDSARWGELRPIQGRAVFTNTFPQSNCASEGWLGVGICTCRYEKVRSQGSPHPGAFLTSGKALELRSRCGTSA